MSILPKRYFYIQIRVSGKVKHKKALFKK